jgi:NAD(P)-dependent dehydrogenase (short-subunit alcohol dehydrogenase family)
MSFEGKVVVITGSSSGIGEALAHAWAARGARVAVNSRSQERADKVTRTIQEQGGTAQSFSADVTSREEVFTMVDRVIEQWGKLDIMVNNAGIPAVVPAEEITEEQWLQPINTLLNGVFWGSQAAARQMIKQGGGVIIQMSSVYGHVANRFRSPYVTAKHGVEGMTKALAIDWAPYGIRVVSIAPAYIGTPMAEPTSSETSDYTFQDVEERTPLHRMGTLDEVVEATLWAASDQASYTTGSSILLDGGWVANGAWARR